MPSRSDQELPGPQPRRFGRLIAFALLVVVFVIALPAVAVQRSAADLVLVDGGTVVADDLYAAGNRIVVEGRIEGDLIAAAAVDVVVAGTVTGDVAAAAPGVVVTGTVGGSVRAVASEVVIDGDVGDDVVALAWRPSVAGSVTGDVVVWGWDATVGGVVGGDLEGQLRTLTMAGTVDGDIDVTVERLRVGDDVVVGGDLGYRSPEAFDGVDRAEVGGTVVHRSPLPPNVRIRAVFLLGKVLLGLMVAVVGLLVIWASPEHAARVAGAVRHSPLRSWLTGLAVMATPLVVAAVAALLVAVTPSEAVLGVVAVVAPLFVAAVGLVALAALFAPVAVYPVVGDPRAGARSRVRAFLLAAVLVTALALLPWVPWILAVTLVPVGIGGWLRPRPTPTPASGL